MAKFSLDTRLGEIIKDYRAKDLVAKHLGAGSLTHPLLPFIKVLTIKQALKHKNNAGFPPESIESLAQELLELD